MLFRTLEEHRQALLAPAWSYMLNYETEWLNRQEIADVTYEAALGFNAAKRAMGVIDLRVAEEVEARISQDWKAVQELDRQMAEYGEALHREEEGELCLAATISKSELEWPSRSFLRSMPKILWNLCRN